MQPESKKLTLFLSLATIAVVSAVLLVGVSRKSSRSTLSLFTAAGSGDLQKVQSLIKQGANIDARVASQWGWTPLMCAIYHNQTNVASYLIEAGCDVNTIDDNGKTPLMMCLAHGDKQADLVTGLIAHGADLYKRDQGGETVFDYAKSLPPKPRIIQILEGARSGSTNSLNQK